MRSRDTVNNRTGTLDAERGLTGAVKLSGLQGYCAEAG